MVRLRQGLACGAYVRIGDDTNRHLKRCGRDDCAEWLTLLNPYGLGGSSAFCFADGARVYRRWKRMKKRTRKRAANAVMVVIIALIVCAAVYFVGRLRGWF